MDTERPASPYAAPRPEQGTDARAPGADKAKISGEGVPPPEVLRDFIGTLNETTDRVEKAIASGAPVKVTESPETPAAPPNLSPEQIMAKVLLFLDNKMRGPITLLGPIRHKFFVMKIPSQQEMIEASSFAGTTIENALELGGKVRIADQAWSLIGELQKACYGWLPERSPHLSLLKQNIADPSKWPELRPTAFLATLDPYMLVGEVYPLWDAYQQWRAVVVPTVAELDFYWANQE